MNLDPQFRSNERQPRKRRKWPFARMVVAVAALAITVIITVAVAGAIGRLPSLASGKTTAQPSATLTATDGKGHVTCDLPGQPKCPTPLAGWLHVASTSASDIVRALQTYPGYISPADMMKGMGVTVKSTSFDEPVLLVSATTGGPDPAANLPHLILRASVNGIRMCTYDVVYDPARRWISLPTFACTDPKDPTYGKPFPFHSVSAASAVASLKAAKGLSLAASTTPQLVFFAGDEARTMPTKTQPAAWQGGGTDAVDAIWRLEGSDGQFYFVGLDGHTYTASELPIAPGTSLVKP